MIPKLIHSLKIDKYIRLNKVKNRWYRPNIFDCRFYLYFFRTYYIYFLTKIVSFFFSKWPYLLLNFKKNQMIAGNLNKNTNMKQTIKLRESELKRMIAETIRSVVNENSFHRGYKAGRNLDVLHTTDGSYRDEDIFSCLAELKSKLKQAEARAKMPQYGNEGEARNYLVAAIRGLQDFINCHY